MSDVTEEEYQEAEAEAEQEQEVPIGTDSDGESWREEGEEVREKTQVAARKQKPKIELYELVDPAWFAHSKEMVALLREFVGIIKIPTITHESLFNYVSVLVERNYAAKMANTPERLIQCKVLGGFSDGRLVGFCVFYMLQNRLPHVMTMDVPYCYSKDIRVSHRFIEEILRCKKLWSAHWIQMIITSDRVLKAFQRFFSHGRVCGTYFFAKGAHHALIDHD